MYSLLMSGNDELWDGEEAEYELGRYLEWTADPIKNQFKELNDETIARLLEIPALFAYEFPLKLPAQVGRIVGIRRKQNEIVFKFAVDRNVGQIDFATIEKLAFDLDIDRKFEIHRHHWAIKDIDLIEVLSKAGIANIDNLRGQKGQIEKLAAGVPKLGLGEEKPRVFVVHGRDNGRKNEVARFLERIGIEAVILHEQANAGRTLISKFQEIAAKVVFAVILITPDDVGGLQGEALRNRARQNVIFELGFFLGKLGSNRVCALVAGDVETPSDFDAVVYVPYDGAGAWKLELARELKEAGVAFDPWKVL